MHAAAVLVVALIALLLLAACCALARPVGLRPSSARYHPDVHEATRRQMEWRIADQMRHRPQRRRRCFCVY